MPFFNKYVFSTSSKGMYFLITFFTYFINMFLKCKITVNSYSKKLFSRAPFYRRVLNIFEFKLNGDRNKLHLLGFTLKI